MRTRINAKVTVDNGKKVDVQIEVETDTSKSINMYKPLITAEFSKKYPDLKAYGSEIVGVVDLE